CDLVVASREAKFGLPEVKRGLAAAAGGLMRLPRRVPYHVAMEYSLTGDMLPATRAYELGLVNRLTEAGGALDAALQLAAAVGANGPLAIAASKQVVVQSGDWTREEMFERQRPLIESVFTSADAREGAAAFAEKRKPVWTGK
ncbi:MAG: enoyl-CoA hydratase-related protein, partial [Pseudomonadota bacterium]